jgi:5-amino-6-(5-phosphoribosylamino)uracil reductase
VLISCTQSLDGYIDDATPDRLLLSNDEHFDYVDAVRASVDAILVGANTVRKDNPRLQVRSEERRKLRTARGRAENPIKVTVVRQGELDPQAAFFTSGPARRLVYTTAQAAAALQQKLGDSAEVIGLGPEPTMEGILADLHHKGVRRLMVEGGSGILTQFLTAGLADELQLAYANFFVGDSAAPRFVGEGQFLWNKDNRLTLQNATVMGDIIVATYLAPALEAADRRFMEQAFALSEQCPPIDSAYSVGAVIVGTDGRVLATGYSWETDNKVHAEEAAFIKLGDTPLQGATLYSTLEPCSKRVSRPKSCTQWIIDNGGITRVVYALPEPLFMQDCQGDELLRQAGLTVRAMDNSRYDYAARFRRLNAATFAKFVEDSK